MWLRERSPDFAAVVLNSPFLSWGEEGLEDMVLNLMGGCVLYPILKCVLGADTKGMSSKKPGRCD